jgi:SepF-like predicted cell division protein (DUF552 family)
MAERLTIPTKRQDMSGEVTVQQLSNGNILVANVGNIHEEDAQRLSELVKTLLKADESVSIIMVRVPMVVLPPQN